MNRSRVKRRRWAAAAAILVAYAVAGFFLVPPIAKSQAEKRLSAELGRAVSIGRLRLNPLMLSATVEDLDIRERDGASSFLGWGRLYVRFDALRSLAGAWVLGDIELDGFHAGVVINRDGSFNFSDLLAKLVVAPGAAAPASGPGRPVKVGRMQVREARVDFADHSLLHPFATTAGPLSFTLSAFQTTGQRGAPYHFAASTESGEKFLLNGTLAADPVSSTGDFEAAGLVLKKYAPYFENRILADVADGRLTVRGRYDVSFDPKGRVLAVNDAEVHLSGLRVVERAGALPLLELGSLDVVGAGADAVAMKASAGRIAVADGHVHARRDKAGRINLLSLVPETHSGPPGRANGPEPKISASEITVDRCTVDVEDQFPAVPARLSVSDLAAEVKDFTLDSGSKIPVKLSLSWAPKGKVAVAGTVTLAPQVGAQLKADVSGLSILPLSPYLEQYLNARITEGSVSTSMSVNASMAGGQPDVSLAGDFSADQLGLVDKAHANGLVGFKHLSLAGIEAGTSPRLTATVSEVGLTGPYARVIVNADGTENLASLAVARAAAPAAASAPRTPPAPAPRVEVGRVTVDGGQFSFTDYSVEPNVRVELGAFAGTVTGLSSENLARADVNLYGMVDGVGPLDITGKLDPLGTRRFVDLKVDVKSVDLVPLSPYSGKFAGFELARGQLVVDTTVLLDGAKLDCSNKVTLNQFNFGAATGSKDATRLPVRLAVALLKDLNGQIFIDLPVQGSLDDPDFKVGKVVWHVIGNLLAKAAASPFSLVGAMFGGGGEELAFQEFDPGSSEFIKDDLQRLATLSKALTNRPALSLGIEGGIDAAADTYALKRVKLAKRIRQQVWEARRAADPNIAPPDQLVIAPEENAAAVKRLFDSTFPPGTTFGTPLPPAPQPAPPPPGPPPGILQRLVYVVTFRKERDASAAQKQSERIAAEHEKAVAQAVAGGLPPEEMFGRLAESTAVTADDLDALAAARARHVRDQLVAAGHIAPDRLFLAKGQGGPAAGARVLLTLQ
jgi:hypothetical protein